MKNEIRHIIRCDGKLLMEERDGMLRLPTHVPHMLGPVSGSLAFSISADDTVYSAMDMALTTGELPAEPTLYGLREAYPRMDENEYRAAGKAMELLHWDSCSRFCGSCGAPMTRSTEISKVCPRCGREVFAQVSPAIIVLVRRGHEALLVHARNFSRPFFGLVAGFVETGESLEECVHREVMEETSLRVKNIRYAGSQPWPYPNSLMLGFTADYDSGELRFADGELTEGGFFSVGNLPLLPSPPSIARRLIDEWIADTRASGS